ncbi:MAG: hydantoinase B/oxoprolinase family protein, partial [Thiohalomonadales bacterium]
MNVIELSLFASRIEACCDEMGAVLQRTAFSTNIKDRLDYSCAIFDAQGALCAQAAHIPVHMGSMAYAMRDIVAQQKWSEGDMLILNDPFLGGTHLPDVTLVAPVFYQSSLLGFAVNRAHHADIGADTPGSMPISSRLEQEGVVIAPTFVVRNGQVQQAEFAAITAGVMNTDQLYGDFVAQMSANRCGVKRILELVLSMGIAVYQDSLVELNNYAERLAKSALASIPVGTYRFSDVLDDDGMGNFDIAICVSINVLDNDIEVDFSGTAKQTTGNVNCPLSVAAAAVYYVFRCLMPSHTPNCDGSLRRIKIIAEQGSLLNARRPAAVAAGNVETSTRVVDCMMGALAQAIPDRLAAASHGSMNNLAMGAQADEKTGALAWSYYETIGGGMGASPRYHGLDARQTHMTNTLNTPIEVLEMNYPLRISRYAVRRGSGGKGQYDGGDGILREFVFLRDTSVTLLTERRLHPPWGLAGGAAGLCGENKLNGRVIAGKISLMARKGDVLSIATAGGGAWGKR